MQETPESIFNLTVNKKSLYKKTMIFFFTKKYIKFHNNMNSNVDYNDINNNEIVPLI
jgi:hypothetical protein